MPHILIVDDERAIRSLLARCFARAGYQVTAAADAFEAMLLCGANAFDAMLSDVDMPEMDGHELVHWIADKHPKMRCALMSGSSIQCEACPFVGGCKLSRKPFSPSEAIAMVAVTLARSAEADPG